MWDFLIVTPIQPSTVDAMGARDPVMAMFLFALLTVSLLPLLLAATRGRADRSRVIGRTEVWRPEEVARRREGSRLHPSL